MLTQLAHPTSLRTTAQHKRLATVTHAQRTHVSSGKPAGATPVLAATAPTQLTITPAEQQQYHQVPEQPSSIKFTKRQLFTFSCACCLALQAQQQQPAAADSGHFSYSGAEGVSSWGGSCSSGTQQSPINLSLTSTACDSTPPPDFRYQPSSGVSVKNTGTTLQVNFPSASNSISWGGQQLELLQYHFHTPSEHSVEGARSSMEAHLVHQNKDTGGYTVLAVLLEGTPTDRTQQQQQQQQQPPNPCLAAGLAAVPPTPGASAPASTPVDPSQLLPYGPALQQYVAYKGSLTTPPCSEGVQWLVWTTPVQVPQQQVAAFRAFAGSNARPVQPLNSRTLAANCIGTA